MVRGVLFNSPKALLSYTFILHQTTTKKAVSVGRGNCLIPLFYIKPQLCAKYHASSFNCLIPLFYIKPQLSCIVRIARRIVLYLYSTSNHNTTSANTSEKSLSYTFILHQTTTHRCLLLHHVPLSYTFILHQTTTARRTWP